MGKTALSTFNAGPEAGRSSHAPYDLNGGVRRFCLDMKGGAAPASFATAPGGNRALQTLMCLT